YSRDHRRRRHPAGRGRPSGNTGGETCWPTTNIGHLSARGKRNRIFQLPRYAVSDTIRYSFDTRSLMRAGIVVFDLNQRNIVYDFGLLNPVWAGTRAAQLTSDAAFGQALLDVEAAWCRAQINFGTAPANIDAVVNAAADITDYDLAAIGKATPDGANALIPLLKALRGKVTAQDSDAEQYIHRGATSQDVIDTALLLVAART